MRSRPATTPSTRQGQLIDRALAHVEGHLDQPFTSGDPTVQPTRLTELPPGIHALTATARGMVARTMTRAAQQAFGELTPAVRRAGLMGEVRSCIALAPDDPQGADDPNCRYIAGLVFGFELATRTGQCARPDIPLTGTLAWSPIAQGPYAVFTHIGPYSTLHDTWTRIYRDWLPASGRTLRDVPPLELVLKGPPDFPPAEFHTEIWLPIA